MKSYAAEFIGTFVLVFCGCGSAILAADHIGYAGVATAFGLALAGMIYTLGPISGCHLNPAVTLALTMSGKFDSGRLLGYMAAQVLGAIVAAAVLYLVVTGKVDSTAIADGFASNGYGDRSPAHYGIVAGFLVEVIMTGLLVLVILGATDLRAPVGFAGLAIGLTLVAIHLVSIPVTNTSVNPARSIGVALFAGSGAIGQLWLFIVAPLLGAAGAAALYRFIRAVEPVVQLPVRQAHQSLGTEQEQRLEKAKLVPTEW